MTLLATFQLLLALGVPWGRAAWGGGQEILPSELRVASGVATFVWIGAALLVLARAGYIGNAASSTSVRRATWLLVALLLFGGALNLASSSPWERFGWGPFALLLAVLVAVVARGPRSAQP
jgi:hypothetical protein